MRLMKMQIESGVRAMMNPSKVTKIRVKKIEAKT
jgi:hypothetical protein